MDPAALTTTSKSWLWSCHTAKLKRGHWENIFWPEWGQENPRTAHHCQAAALQGLSGAAMAVHAEPGSCQQLTVLPSFFRELLQAWLLPRKDERRREPEQCGLEGRGQRKHR